MGSEERVREGGLRPRTQGRPRLESGVGASALGVEACRDLGLRPLPGLSFWASGRPGWDLAPAQWGLTAGSRRRRPRRCKPAACSVAAPRHSSGPSCPSHRAVGEFRSGGHDPRPGLLVVWTLSTGRAGAKSFVCHLTDPQTCQGMPAALVLVRGGGRGPRVQWRCSKRSALVARLRSAGLHARGPASVHTEPA